jgi:putative transposase
MDEKQEFRLRRKAIRMHVQGSAQQEILAGVQRCRAWLSKWQTRFDQEGTAGLHSRSRRPAHTPTTYSSRIRQLIVQTRRRLVKQKVGLIGARAVQRELRKVIGSKSLPSLSTIKRVLRQRGLIAQPNQAKRLYFPKPLQVVSGSLHALDWTSRYLEEGLKIYAFHTLNLHTRACTQTIATDKSYETVRRHCLQTWKSLGPNRQYIVGI